MALAIKAGERVGVGWVVEVRANPARDRRGRGTGGEVGGRGGRGGGPGRAWDHLTGHIALTGFFPTAVMTPNR